MKSQCLLCRVVGIQTEVLIHSCMKVLTKQSLKTSSSSMQTHDAPLTPNLESRSPITWTSVLMRCYQRKTLIYHNSNLVQEDLHLCCHHSSQWLQQAHSCLLPSQLFRLKEKELQNCSCMTETPIQIAKIMHQELVQHSS